MDQREQDQQFSISASEYWFSQQRQSYWCLISLLIVILVGLGGFYPDKHRIRQFNCLYARFILCVDALGISIFLFSGHT